MKNNIDDNFELIKKQKLNNLQELFDTLKAKKKLLAFSNQSGIDLDYLTILIREIKSLRQNPNKIKDFPNIADNVVVKLENIGVKNTLQLFDKVLTPKSRKELSEQTEINENEILKITKLTDISRIKWVNHTFAYVLFEANYDTVKKVANADFNKLYENVKELNKKKNLYKAHIGLNNMKICVQAAKDLSLDIKY